MNRLKILAGLFLGLNLGMPGAIAATGPALSVNVANARQPISDDIYGMNFAAEALASELRLPVRRYGGNSTTRYNWQIDVHNTASDFYFENVPDGNSTNLPNGSTTDLFVDQDRRTGTRSLITVPLIGWTPKRRKGHPFDCGFKVSVYGAANSWDFMYDPDCGDGNRPRPVPNGSPIPITGNDPADTSVTIDPTFVTAWINHLVGRYGTATNGGVAYYNLDNEPALWNSTHRDVHPAGLSFDELRNKTYQYAAAIKAADPGAKTLGPAEWGWCAYYYSALDGGCGPGADQAAHNNLASVVYYLQQMKAYESANGVRILDYLDLHFYPQANGVALQPAGDAVNQALRLRSTRNLWDPAYTDESYIVDLSTPHELMMIPRMKGWVATNYPGTKIAISEYNWGAPESINGALAQAEVLGIFGREGLDLATMWDPPASAQPGAFAFRMYRNYDGAKHGFGETSVQATSADSGNLSIFAAQRASDNALTLLVINKSAGDLTSAVAIAGFTPQASAAVYRYSGASLATIQQPAAQAVTSSGFTATFPANSITLFVVAPNVTLDPAGDNDGDGIPNGVEIAEGRNPLVKDNDVFGNARLFAMQQYRDFLGREGDSGGITSWTNYINGGGTRAAVTEAFFTSTEFQGTGAPVARLYFAYFLRIPDYGGLTFWINYFRTGHTLAEISSAFAASGEFTSRYGALTNDQFVDLVYQNVLGRPADAGGKSYWLGQLNGGMPRGQMMIGFSESVEYLSTIASSTYVTMMYVGMLKRQPDTSGFNFWVGYLNQGNSGQALINGFLGAAEYRSRFLP